MTMRILRSLVKFRKTITIRKIESFLLININNRKSRFLWILNRLQAVSIAWKLIKSRTSQTFHISIPASRKLVESMKMRGQSSKCNKLLIKTQQDKIMMVLTELFPITLTYFILRILQSLSSNRSRRNLLRRSMIFREVRTINNSKTHSILNRMKMNRVRILLGINLLVVISKNLHH